MDKQQFHTGAVRDRNVAGSKQSEFPARYDLLSPIALRRLAQTYGEGAAKYDDHNWRKGMPFSSTVNHALAHIVAYMNGDKSEDHLSHAAWNLFALMHFEETMPEMNDLKFDDYRESDKPVDLKTGETFSRLDCGNPYCQKCHPKDVGRKELHAILEGRAPI